ncbi:B-type cyclin [Pleurotus ostreatus]|uniref:Uncharacterized protein n=1 Tax=Pleurotus cornucopiae TaxID=5321 RepID=A0ACB7J3R1_PLECO|nr:hypothetical protein CCMSSC00406_0001989 [Pleurotus cornucopiae]KAJ8692637.1 B-type cyclin [Pleurotus ostreatus]
MASNQQRLSMRPRAMTRGKVDENATSRHIRQPSTSTVNGVARMSISGVKAAGQPGRVALSEVTTTAVNRRDSYNKLAGKEKEETGLKRSRSSNTITTAQRVPLRSQASTATGLNTRGPAQRIQPQRPQVRNSRLAVHQTFVPPLEEDEDQEDDCAMEVEQHLDVQNRQSAHGHPLDEEPEEQMVDLDESEDEEETARVRKHPRIWPDMATEARMRQEQQVKEITDKFVDQVDVFDTTMVSEYAEDIFEYMGELEEEMMPNGDYMATQHELNWSMRQTLVDWLLQVHLRYHMVPETLWIAINIIDRFLSKRVVSLVKLQLVGVTAMFIAAKYEEIVAPSVEEFVFMTENGYSKEEILKGERIMLQTLDFKISHYCSPYSWMRKISKADDYDIQTRTLSKFLTEVTLLDHRFLRAKPSLVAAVGMYTARKMLGGDWNEGFTFYSGFTEEQLLPGHLLLIDKLVGANFGKMYVHKKYAHKKFLKASIFATEWARVHAGDDLMALEE